MSKITLKEFKATHDNAAITAINNVYHDLRDRNANPAGYFDKAGRFYLSDDVRQCSYCRAPSRAYPYSEMKEGRSRSFLMRVWIANNIENEEQLRNLTIA